VEFIKGIQGEDPKYMLSMACAKHYAVHSGPEPDRHRFDARPSERDLYETYLPQFERAVREGRVGGIMGAYNSLNGVPCSASSFLLDDLLRKQWGLMVMSSRIAMRSTTSGTPTASLCRHARKGCRRCRKSWLQFVLRR